MSRLNEWVKISEKMKEQYPKGSRVRLLKMNYEKAPPIGTMGTVKGVNAMGSILVNWDNGSALPIVYEEDACEIVTEEG